MARDEVGRASKAQCPICGGAGTFVLSAGDRFYEVTDYVADLYCCGECGSLFQWPVPSREVIAQFYPGGYWREETQPTLMGRLQKFYVQSMLKLDLMAWVRKLKLKPGARFADVGCSRGDWLSLIKGKGMKTLGVEADPRAATYARKQFGLEIDEVNAEAWEPETAGFDVVSFFHLLEHLGNPAAFLGKCHKALDENGRILLRVPNAGSWQRIWFGALWKGLELPRHLILYTPSSLKSFLEREGFVVEKMSTWSLRDGPPAMSSSILPAGEPTRQEILGKSQPILTLAYLALTWLCAPIEGLASLFGKGSMITLIARKAG